MVWFTHKKAYKHIFIRDVFKQWYLAGINSNINTPEKLIEFLRKETEGYHTVMLGSSAGAYAAILYGSLLQTKKVLAFNPQYELKSLLNRSSEKINPLVFRLEKSGKTNISISSHSLIRIPIFIISIRMVHNGILNSINI